MSNHLHDFINSFGFAAPEAALWVAVIEQAKLDLKHRRKEVRDDAESFLFDEDDDRLCNLIHMLGLDGELSKQIMVGIVSEV